MLSPEKMNIADLKLLWFEENSLIFQAIFNCFGVFFDRKERGKLIGHNFKAFPLAFFLKLRTSQIFEDIRSSDICSILTNGHLSIALSLINTFELFFDNRSAAGRFGHFRWWIPMKMFLFVFVTTEWLSIVFYRSRCDWIEYSFETSAISTKPLDDWLYWRFYWISKLTWSDLIDILSLAV